MKYNFDFYNDKDTYSDGDIEETLLDYTLKYEDGEYDEVFKTDVRWPIFYHLSKIRQNIITWYPIDKNSEILEIGAGPRCNYRRTLQESKICYCSRAIKKKSNLQWKS